MRRLIFRPIVLLLTFLTGLFLTFLITFALEGLERLIYEPSETIPALHLSGIPDRARPCIEPTTEQEEEYAVYSALLNLLSESERGELIVLQDHTTNDFLGYESIERTLEPLQQGSFPLAQETLDAFLANNERSQSLENLTRSTENLFCLPVRTTLASRSEVESYFGRRGGWQLFYRKYRGAAGLVTLSKVGFSRDRSQALVYQEFTCDDTCGRGSFVALFKDGNVWRVRSQAGTWIS
ncbi:MAG TPA: hypothetical protein VF553_11855 [Pyrinomonadaceae bacterium]|jgi:hypothetical protein